MTIEVLHPYEKGEVVQLLRAASRDGRRILAVGGRQHMDRGEPCEMDAELWTRQLDGLVSYEPAEMVAVVGAGMRVGELQRILAGGGQEWPVDAPAEATVGGVIAAGASSPRRMRGGTVRDTVLEVELATGDGRLVKGGARTVKQSTGYSLPRLATGSLGTLGVIVQAALKVRPLPKSHRTLIAQGDGLSLSGRMLDVVPLPAAVLATPSAAEVRLEGWTGEVEEQTEIARSVAPDLEVEDDVPFPSIAPWDAMPIVTEAAVPPSRLPSLVAAAGDAWGALLGVGVAWIGLPEEGDALEVLRRKASELGGIAPVIRGEGGLGYPVPAPEVHRRLKQAFDPAGILAPGRLGSGS